MHFTDIFVVCKKESQKMKKLQGEINCNRKKLLFGKTENKDSPRKTTAKKERKRGKGAKDRKSNNFC